MLDGEDLASRAGLLAGYSRTLGRTFDARGLDNRGRSRDRTLGLEVAVAGAGGPPRDASGSAGRAGRHVGARRTQIRLLPRARPLIGSLLDWLTCAR